MNDQLIVQQLETLYNRPISEIARIHPEEVEQDLTDFNDEALRLGFPTLPFTADEANAAISRTGLDAEGD